MVVKFILMILSIFLTINLGKSDHVHIVTAYPYQWFPLRTNHLRFAVKAQSDIYVRLSALPNTDEPFYSFIIGRDHNSESALKRDIIEESVVIRKGTFLTPKRYNSFSIIVDEVEGSVSLIKGHNETIINYKDPNFMKMSYFGISTLDSVPGEWWFDFDAVFPSKCNN